MLEDLNLNLYGNDGMDNMQIMQMMDNQAELKEFNEEAKDERSNQLEIPKVKRVNTKYTHKSFDGEMSKSTSCLRPSQNGKHELKIIGWILKIEFGARKQILCFTSSKTISLQQRRYFIISINEEGTSPKVRVSLFLY